VRKSGARDAGGGVFWLKSLGMFEFESYEFERFGGLFGGLVLMC
jgi:hypothetical protein